MDLKKKNTHLHLITHKDHIYSTIQNLSKLYLNYLIDNLVERKKKQFLYKPINKFYNK